MFKKSQKIKNPGRNILFSSPPSTSRYTVDYITLLEQIPSSFFIILSLLPEKRLLLTLIQMLIFKVELFSSYYILISSETFQ